LPAYTNERAVNTSGAGDALFAAFIDGAVQGMTAVTALERAIVFAGAKVAGRTSSEGDLGPAALDKETARYRVQQRTEIGP
jgi:ribokinase